MNGQATQFATLSLHAPPAAPTSLTLSWTKPSSDSTVSAEVQIRRRKIHKIRNKLANPAALPAGRRQQLQQV